MHMNKADLIFKETVKNIMENGVMDINPRPKYKDGTPAHTKFINHVVHTYDLEKGEEILRLKMVLKRFYGYIKIKVVILVF